MELIVKGADFSENRIGVVEKKINTAIFNGTSSCAEITPLTFSQSGDYLEFLLNIEETSISKYFALRGLWTSPTIAITKTKLSLRLDGNTWAISSQSISIADISNAKIKIAFDGVYVKVYIDDTLSFTYDNSSSQESLTFAGFGRYSSSSGTNFWKGSIKKLRTNKLNDGNWLGLDEVPGYVGTDIVLV